MNLIEELQWRGMLRDIMPGTAEQLAKEMTSGYIGFDPTSDSLHIGSLVPILLLVHLQRAGHKPVALVGGATGMVGDPSGKSEERNLLSEDVLRHNLAAVKQQLEKFLDFDSGKPNAAAMVNNYDWFRDMRFLDFIRDVGKHITVNYMSAKDSVKKRLESENGMSFTEFTYQLVQGYDFYWLYTHINCKLQMGGSDQWGNITTGAELIRRKCGGEAFAFTCPLLTKSDGGKFGKTEKGNIWLDPEKTSPYQFYQFWLNASDADAEKWIRIFTFLDRHEIESLAKEYQKYPGERVVQKKLAKEITIFVHGEDGYEQALGTSGKVFMPSSGSASMTIQDIQQLSGVTEFTISASKFDPKIDIVTVLADSGSFASKREARTIILQGGLSLNGEKVNDISKQISSSDLISGQYLYIHTGKKNFSLIKAINVLEEFGSSPGDSSFLTPSSIEGGSKITQTSDRRLGQVYKVSGKWEEGSLTWTIKDSANKADLFEYICFPEGRFTFYLGVHLWKGVDKAFKWIRFEPSFLQHSAYTDDAVNEKVYVNSVSKENALEKSTVDIHLAISETFGQGGWTFDKLNCFRVKGEGKIKRVILAKK